MARANVSARVVISKDGPYLVTGSPPLSKQTIITDSDGGSEWWQEGETFAVQKNYALCRRNTGDVSAPCSIIPWRYGSRTYKFLAAAV
jgi:hypothetical protein